MSHIFISYASQDRPKAQVLAQALTEHGWSVWWDRTIPTGKRFEQVIQEALAGARCVMVLWSKQSVASDWVVEEAEEGRKRHMLVPVFIEDVLPPMGFRRIQAADLIAWDGAGTSPAFQKLVVDIAGILGPPVKTDIGQVAPASPEARTLTTGTPVREQDLPAREQDEEKVLDSEVDTGARATLTPSGELAVKKKLRLESTRRSGPRGERGVSTPAEHRKDIKGKARLPRESVDLPSRVARAETPEQSAVGTVSEEKIIRVLKAFRKHFTRTYIYPQIPDPIRDNARKACGVPNTERIIGVIDFTVGGIPPKITLVFGTNSIYYKTLLQKTKLPYSEFPKRTFQVIRDSFLTGRWISIGKNQGIGTGMASAQPLVDALNAIKDEIVRMHS